MKNKRKLAGYLNKELHESGYGEQDFLETLVKFEEEVEDKEE